MDETTLQILTVVFGLYGLLLAAAAISDAWRYIIPNSITVALIGLFVADALLLPIEVDWLSHLGAAGAVLAGGIALFAFGKLGGGDVKLLTATSLWVGLDQLLYYIAFVAIAGGGLTVLLLVLRRVIFGLRVSLPGRIASLPMPRVLLTGEHIPYALAIAPIAIWYGFRLPMLGAYL